MDLNNRIERAKANSENVDRYAYDPKQPRGDDGKWKGTIKEGTRGDIKRLKTGYDETHALHIGGATAKSFHELASKFGHTVEDKETHLIAKNKQGEDVGQFHPQGYNAPVSPEEKYERAHALTNSANYDSLIAHGGPGAYEDKLDRFIMRRSSDRNPKWNRRVMRRKCLAVAITAMRLISIYPPPKNTKNTLTNCETIRSVIMTGRSKLMSERPNPIARRRMLTKKLSIPKMNSLSNPID